MCYGNVNILLILGIYYFISMCIVYSKAMLSVRYVFVNFVAGFLILLYAFAIAFLREAYHV